MPNNTSQGINALYKNSGDDNTAIGAGALFENTSGDENTGIGSSALGISKGYKNTSVGRAALYAITGDYNAAIGCNSGSHITSLGNPIKGNGNTFLGCETKINLDMTANGGDIIYNSTAIGYGAKITRSNQIVLGGKYPDDSIVSYSYPDVIVPGSIHVLENIQVDKTLKSKYIESSEMISCKYLTVSNDALYSKNVTVNETLISKYITVTASLTSPYITVNGNVTVRNGQDTSDMNSYGSYFQYGSSTYFDNNTVQVTPDSQVYQFRNVPGINIIGQSYSLLTLKANGDMAVSGRITTIGITTTEGVNAGTITTSGNVSATGTVSGGTVSATNVSASGTVSGVTVSATNVSASGTVSGVTVSATNVSASGSLSSPYITVNGNVTVRNAQDTSDMKMYSTYFQYGSSSYLDNYTEQPTSDSQVFQFRNTPGNNIVGQKYGLLTLKANGKATFAGDVTINEITVGRGLTDNGTNTAVGIGCLQKSISDANIVNSGLYNTAVGYSNLSESTTGFYNTAVGSLSLERNTTGYENTAVGVNSLVLNTTGYSNTAVGINSLFSNVGGYSNTAVGIDSLSLNVDGSSNTAVGRYSLHYLKKGVNNVAIGSFAGSELGANNNDCSNNTFLGPNTDVNDNNQSYYGSTAIGYGARITASNQIVLGTVGQKVSIPGSITLSSQFVTPVEGQLGYKINGTNFLARTATDDPSYWNISSGSYFSTSSITLPPGVWHIYGQISYNVYLGTTVYNETYYIDESGSNPTFEIAQGFGESTMGTGYNIIKNLNAVVSITSSKTYYLGMNIGYNNTSTNTSYSNIIYNSASTGYTKFYAVRMA